MKLSPFIKRLKNALRLQRNNLEKLTLDDGDDVLSEKVTKQNHTDEIPRSKLNRFAWFIYGTFLVIVLGGAGLLVGWVLVSAEKTIEKRIAITPSVTVDVLADGETAPKNSSRDNRQLGDQAAEDDSETAIANQSKETKNRLNNSDALVGIIFPHITEETETGPLPVIAPDGRQPWLEYSRGFKRADRKPRIALIISNLGLSDTYTKATLELLPEDITLSFSHVAPRLKSWVREARQKGHEILLDIPMEPIGFPKNDPGRATLLTSSNEVENLNRLEHIMKQAGGYVGLLGTLGTKFMLHSETFLPVLRSIKQRGLIYVDSRSTSRSLGPELASSIQLPKAFNNVFVDKEPSQEKIKNKLDELERIALKRRFAVGIAQPLPITIEILSQWTKGLKTKQIALAPITAIVDKQSQR
ncbi:MAG: hypothetical protein CMM15_07265 [Rhodospirillaceae bacterium]|nr:hypothetical protein [Rhodospirillaceae bacterium]OUU24318.1 MAG: hypothetical protein CBB97_11855 [Candidatus Endolissoclinum sp. TMED37]